MDYKDYIIPVFLLIPVVFSLVHIVREKTIPPVFVIVGLMAVLVLCGEIAMGRYQPIW